jgi:membrane protease YdiL (CAAX protease family)
MYFLKTVTCFYCQCRVWCLCLVIVKYAIFISLRFCVVWLQPVSNPILKEILMNSDISRVSCVAAYCIVTPLLEEVVYRGFLLTSLSSTMKWQNAVVISSVIFSAIHFSGENFVQLFIIGCVLGCSYCWTGNLKSSIVIHSLYNALTLLITYFY